MQVRLRFIKGENFIKTFNNIAIKFTNDEIINNSIKEATRGGKKKKKKRSKKCFIFLDNTRDYIKNEIFNFKNDKHIPKTIYDGIKKKKRTIIVPSLREQIIHHIVVESFSEFFLHGIYNHVYGSIPGRGAHKGKKVLSKWIREDQKNCQYILKLDIKKYFESIPHDILKNKISKEVKDKKALKILFEIIDATKKGLPLGFYTSQWLSMWYLKDFDHYVKEQCYAPHYMRYMDDMVIMGANKELLIETFNKIKKYLSELGLTLNSKSQLFQLCWFEKKNKKIIKHGRDIDFMGFRFYRNKTVLRKSIMIKMTRKANNIFKIDKPSIYQLQQMISYISYIKNSKIYNVWLIYIKPVFNYKKAKRRIGNYDKKINKINDILSEKENITMFNDFQEGKIFPIFNLNRKEEKLCGE